MIIDRVSREGKAIFFLSKAIGSVLRSVRLFPVYLFNRLTLELEFVCVCAYVCVCVCHDHSLPG